MIKNNFFIYFLLIQFNFLFSLSPQKSSEVEDEFSFNNEEFLNGIGLIGSLIMNLHVS